MTEIEAKNGEILPSRGLNNLTDEQRMRIGLLVQEMMEAGASHNGIRNAIKHAYDKEIIFAVHTPERQYPIQLQLR